MSKSNEARTLDPDSPNFVGEFTLAIVNHLEADISDTRDTLLYSTASLAFQEGIDLGMEIAKIYGINRERAKLGLGPLEDTQIPDRQTLWNEYAASDPLLAPVTSRLDAKDAARRAGKVTH